MILSLERTKVTDAGLVHLEGLGTLDLLLLDGTRVSDQGKAGLQKVIPGLSFDPLVGPEEEDEGTSTERDPPGESADTPVILPETVKPR